MKSSTRTQSGIPPSGPPSMNRAVKSATSSPRALSVTTSKFAVPWGRFAKAGAQGERIRSPSMSTIRPSGGASVNPTPLVVGQSPLTF